MVDDLGDDGSERLLRLEQLKQRLRVSPGAQAKARWDSLQRSDRVFKRNAHELMQVLLLAEREEQFAVELIQNVRPTSVRREYFGLLDQRLHNMLASAVSLGRVNPNPRPSRVPSPGRPGDAGHGPPP